MWTALNLRVCPVSDERAQIFTGGRESPPRRSYSHGQTNTVTDTKGTESQRRSETVPSRQGGTNTSPGWGVEVDQMETIRRVCVFAPYFLPQPETMLRTKTWKTGHSNPFQESKGLVSKGVIFYPHWTEIIKKLYINSHLAYGLSTSVSLTLSVSGSVRTRPMFTNCQRNFTHTDGTRTGGTRHSITPTQPPVYHTWGSIHKEVEDVGLSKTDPNRLPSMISF